MATDAIAIDNTPVLPPVLRAWPVLAALIGLAVLGWGIVQTIDDGGPRIERLQLNGDFTHLEPQALRDRITPFLGGGFFAVDLDGIREALESEPWIAQARVRRAWPGTLQVTIGEHRLVARWGESQALSARGALFAPPGLEDEVRGLPRLEGPKGRSAEVLEAYRALAQRLGETPMAPDRVRMDARGEWYMTTADGIELRLGREAPLRQADRLATEVLPALAEELSRVEYVDLRYSNGFAVGWRAAAAKPDGDHG